MKSAAHHETEKTTKALKNDAAETKSKAKTVAANEGEHLDKDGTPDMRYNENKSAEQLKDHLTKDGKPDKRYKENK